MRAPAWYLRQTLQVVSHLQMLMHDLSLSTGPFSMHSLPLLVIAAAAALAVYQWGRAVSAMLYRFIVLFRHAAVRGCHYTAPAVNRHVQR